MLRFAASLILRPHRLTVRTAGSHPANRSSILRGVTNNFQKKLFPKYTQPTHEQFLLEIVGVWCSVYFVF